MRSSFSKTSTYGFGTSSRFTYYPVPKSKRLRMTQLDAASPVPENRNSFSPDQTSVSFSFGVSRESAKKVHVSAAEKKASMLPAPGRYELPSCIGKTGPKYSMRANTSRTQSKLPLVRYPGV